MTIQKNGSKVTLYTDERIDTNGAPQFAVQMEKALEGAQDLTLDCEKLTYISSSALRVVLLAVKAMARQGDMRIINVRESVYEILETTGFTGACNVELKA